MDVSPFLVKPSKKTSFSEKDMEFLSVNGREKGWDSVMPSARGVKYKLCARKMLMIDRVTHVFPNGGAHGLGLILGEKILDRNHWYFPCHFHKDQVMAGSLVADGCSQLLKLYMVWLGLHNTVDKLVFRPVPGTKNKVRCRGAIEPQQGKLVYVMEITEMGFDEKTGYPYAKALVNIINVNFEKGESFDLKSLDEYGRGRMDRRIVVDFQGIALQIEGKPTGPHPSLGGAFSGAASRTSVPRGMSQTTSMVSRSPCPTKEPPAKFMKWGMPKGPEAINTWHPLAGKNGAPVPGFAPTEFPPRKIAFLPFPGNPADNNHTPGELPLGWYNLTEFTTNRTSKCLGMEFARFDESETSKMPAFDLQLVTRVLEVTGMEKGNFHGVDCNPGKGTMVAEFDCPSDAWFYKAGSADNHMPYSILMEIALQVSGVLTSWLKAPLTLDKDNLLFRNLDATATLVKDIDLRNKTIVNTTTAKSYSMLGSMGIHTFHAELAVDGEVFYIVDTSFGWFLPEVFLKQTGLDSGKKRLPWHKVEGKGQGTPSTFNLTDPSDKKRLYADAPSASASGIRRRDAQASFVDKIVLIPNSGKHGKGYVSGSKIVNKQDWFFSCHFWCDPVMPGSLGIESMVECMEMFAANQGLTRGFKCPTFFHGEGTTKWKYRGQLTPKNNRMDNEVHIKSVEKQADGSVVILADAGLYVDSLRVYEAIDLRLRIAEAVKGPTTASQTSAVLTPVRRSGGESKQPQAPSTALRLIMTPSSTASPSANDFTPVQSMREDEAVASIKEALHSMDRCFFAHLSSVGKLCGLSDTPAAGAVEVRACNFANLSNDAAAFMRVYGCRAPLYTGAMAKGIASADLVCAAGKAGILASLGAGGLPLGSPTVTRPNTVESCLDQIQRELKQGEPFAVNLIHSPFDDLLEKGCVEILLRRGVRVIEASAFMTLTKHVVRYRVAGLRRLSDGTVECQNKIIFKVSRTELAEMALRPAPDHLLEKLLEEGLITPEQAQMSKEVPMCDDIAVESDSGGHTDNRPFHVIYPLIARLRDRVCRELGFTNERRVRVGVGGGIGCPESVLAAFSMGAAFVVTGTVNQMARQAGTVDQVRKVLSEATYSDVTMAPAADMFDQGVELQVLKKGTMFPSRAKKLFSLFQLYNSLEEIPPKEMKNVEKRIFRKSAAEVWQETRNFYINRLKDPEKVERAEKVDPKLKMSMTFRWYLSKSSGWANRGENDRKLDYQIWCGPAIGSFNDFIRGSYLDPKVAQQYPCVVQTNLQLLTGACYLRRLQSLTRCDALKTDLDELNVYFPRHEL